MNLLRGRSKKSPVHQQQPTRGIYKAIQHKVALHLSVAERERLFFTLLGLLTGHYIPYSEYTILSVSNEVDGKVSITCIRR